jgi:signal transduction histidine kinase
VSTELSDLQEVTADSEMIGAVLRNLLSNAIKYTRPGGKINITALPFQQGLKVTVTDNGVGIELENLCKLFRIDENLTTLGTQNEEGTGLGLILCKEFIDKHHGKIWVESEIGKGSSFSFTIPKKSIVTV